MASLDIFNDNAFSMASLTAAMEVAPYQPQLLGRLGLFKEDPIRTVTAFVEKRAGRLHLLHTAARGTVKDVRSASKRTMIPIEVPHVPYYQSVLAGDIQNVRAFGSETELEAVSSYINEQLIAMRKDHEVTQEYHRVGALQGIVYDADGTTELVDLFDIFDLTRIEVNFASTASSFATICTQIIREIAGALGSASFNQIVALCGNDYFDGVVSHASTQDAYDRWRNGEFKRVSMLGPEWYSAAANGFEFQNILFINYRGNIDDITFVADDEAYYFPTGVMDMFKEVLAPADFMETVNTAGKRFYAKQRMIEFDKGVELHTQSNTLAICTRPNAVIKSTYSASSSS